VPDVEYTQHENTFLRYLRKRNQWVKLSEAGRRDARWHNVTFTLDFSLDFLALKGLENLAKHVFIILLF